VGEVSLPRRPSVLVAPSRRSPQQLPRLLGVSPPRDYAIFGGCLRSDVPIPELPAIDCCAPDWTFRRVEAPVGPSEFLGEERVDASVRVRCSRLNNGIRLEFDDTGVFDVSAGGQDIAWTPGPAPTELVRADLLGGVLSVALYLQGLLVLHGSGVGIDGTAVGFVANKGGGKSTLATALCAAGGTLITDDALPVHVGPPATAWPSMPAVRLLQDSATQLRHARGHTHPQTNKYHVNELPQDQVELRRLPIGAIYELAPVPATPGVPAVTRERITGPAAVSTLLRHHKPGNVIGGADSIGLFMRTTDIVRTVPVYRLNVTRDFERLPEVTAQIHAWHAGRSATHANGPA
jgi:hypothetical protein